MHLPTRHPATTFMGLLAALALLAGCGVKPPIEGRVDPYPQGQIHFASKDLRDKTAVGLPVMERRDGILYVTVPIRSASNYDLRVDYRVTFFNAQGQPIYTSGWEAASKLISNVPSEIQVHSLTGDAADFRLDLRYSQ